MKFAAFTLLAFMTSNFALAKNHTMRTHWEQMEQTSYDTIMKVGDTLTVTLPLKSGSKPTAAIEESNSRCEIISAKVIGKEYQVKVAYKGEAEVSRSHHNNCQLYLDRNHKSDTEDAGFTTIEFGGYVNSSFNFTTKLKWTDEMANLERDMNDGDTVTISLPAKAGSKPRAEIKEGALASCSLISLKQVGKEILVKVSLDETERDEGFNGCTVYIERNHKDDDESNGQVYLEFGYYIDG